MWLQEHWDNQCVYFEINDVRDTNLSIKGGLVEVEKILLPRNGASSLFSIKDGIFLWIIALWQETWNITYEKNNSSIFLRWTFSRWYINWWAPVSSVCDSISGSALRLSVEERRVSSAMFVHSFHVGRTVYKIEYFKECLCKVE